MSYQNLKALEVNTKKVDKPEVKKPKTFLKNLRLKSPSKSPSMAKRKSPAGKPGPSKKKKDEIDYDIPDRSFGDLYCRPCDAHMNSDQMWQAHIQGKRHLKHAKKGEQSDSKFEYVDEVPEMQYDIDTCEEAIPGLQHLCETQRIEQRAIYQCFLCSSNIATPDQVIEHLLGFKHRMAFLKEHDPAEYQLLNDSQMRKGHLESVVEEKIRNFEAKNGRGKMVVKREKFKADEVQILPRSYKKDSRSDDQDYRSSSHGNDRFKEKKHPDDRKQPPNIGYFPDTQFPPSTNYPMDPGYFPPNRAKAWDEESERFIREQEQFRRERERVIELEREYERRATSRADSPTFYRRSVVKDSEISSHNSRSIDAHRNQPASDLGFGDLREKLEKKKVLEPQRTVSMASSQPLNLEEISSTTGIPDLVLGLVNVIPPSSFLQLILWKLDNSNLESKLELELLEKVMQKVTALCIDMKQKQISPILRAKFQESMALNGVQLPERAGNGGKNLDQMIEFFKSNSNQKPSQPSNFQGQGNFSAPPEQGNPGTSSGVYSNSLWERLPSTTPFSLSSDSTPIPGLTLAEEKQMPSPAPVSAPIMSPFTQLAQKTKSLFGNYSPMVGYPPSNQYRR